MLLWPLASLLRHGAPLSGAATTLHRLVYVIAIGGVVHYLWLVKKDIRLPVIYGLVLALLLGLRLAYALRRPLVEWLAARRALGSGATLERVE